MIWLWLEDNKNSVTDISEILEQGDINILKFETPNLLSKYLADNLDNLDNFGLIIDVMLENQSFIILTEELTKKNEDLLFKTNNSYDAGIVYIKEVILNKDSNFWKPSPPIIFLTVRGDQDDNIIKDIDEIKEKISNNNNISKDQVKLEWVRKWDASLDPEKFIETIKKFEET